MASTEAWFPENAQVHIYNHEEKEVAGSTIDGSNTEFTLTNSPAAITGSYLDSNGSALTQYTDASGNIARRDILVFKRKNGGDTEWNTNSDGSIIVEPNGSVLSFETAPTTTQADSLVVTYEHTKAEKSDEVLSVSESGGERPVEFIQAYNAKQIKTSRTQQSFSVDLEVLKSDLSFATFVNGAQVSEDLTSGVGGSVDTVTGASTRANKALVVDGSDPDTGNRLLLLYFNVSGVSKSLDGPAEENFSETVTFQSKAKDKTEVYWES